MKAVKNTVKSNKGAKNTANASATVQAVALKLDTKANHGMRVSFASMGVDLFALHALKTVSEGYRADIKARASDILKRTGGENNAVLFAGAVANRICVDNKTGDYSRLHGKGGLNERVCGNVNALSQLYGKSVMVLSDAQLAERFAAQKEQVTKRIGNGKGAREVTGREVATDGDHFVMLAQLENGKFAIHNGEHSRNVHNYSVRATLIKSTDAKA